MLKKYKLILILLSISYFQIYGQVAELTQKALKAKDVYIGGFFGDIYGYLGWNPDVETGLAKKGYSPANIDTIRKYSMLANHPVHLKSHDLFFANKYHLNNYNCKLLLEFSSEEPTSKKTLSYKLIWIPLASNTQALEGFKPANENGFYYMMYKSSIKSSKEPKENLSVVTQEDLDAKFAGNRAALKQKEADAAERAERLKNTNTVAFILRKNSSGFGSASVFYAAVFVEVYDRTKRATEGQFKAAAQREFDALDRNGYFVEKEIMEYGGAEALRGKVNSAITLSDSKTLYTEIR